MGPGHGSTGAGQQLQQPATVDFVKGTQAGIRGLFSDMVVISWAYTNMNPDEASTVERDAAQLSAKLSQLLQNSGMPDDVSVRYVMHTATLNTEKSMASQWRGLFAQAIIKLDILEREPS